MAAKCQFQWHLRPVRLLWRQEIRDVLLSEGEYGLKCSFADSASSSSLHCVCSHSHVHRGLLTDVLSDYLNAIHDSVTLPLR
jgi:hypothetical protein